MDDGECTSPFYFKMKVSRSFDGFVDESCMVCFGCFVFDKGCIVCFGCFVS